MGWNFVRWLVVGAAAVLVLQPAQAGDRKSAMTARAAVSAREFVSGGQVRSAAPMKMQGRGELGFFQVTPFESRSAVAGNKPSRQREEQRASGPATSPRERKTITLLQFNPNVSVQPVIGGVNGAQLSVGF